MSSARLLVLTTLVAPVLMAQTASTSRLSGMAILQKMSEQYAGAQSWHIVVTEERTNWNDYRRYWQKTVIVSAVSGNRYHFEGHSDSGSALHVSDGRTAWNFHPEEHAFTREASPSDRYQPPPRWFMNEAAAQRAVGLLSELGTFASHYSGATRLQDQNLILAGKAIPCYVVRLTDEQRKGPRSATYTSEKTLWIEKATWRLRRTAEHGKSDVMITGTLHLASQYHAVATYSIVVLNCPVPDSLFHFEPPQHAQLVAKFSENALGPDLTGQTAPDVQLVGLEGKHVALSSYRGKPVLLDFWATWCAPCTDAMPKLAVLDKEAGPKGLVLLSIDEDEDAKSAHDYLAQHQYAWPNTHDDGKIGDAFGKLGIPLYVLIDAQGRIVYYASGTGRRRCAKRLGA